VAVVGLVTLWAYAPRVTYLFPSLIDDWSAIAKAPEQLRDVVALGNPEAQRYRPGFIMWNALQWHTLGAPNDFLGPQFWGLARAAVLVLGVTLLAALLIVPASDTSEWRDRRWLLVAGVPLAAITAPSLAIDLARFGPQEPLLVGCMALGAVLLVYAVDSLLRGEPPTTSVVLASVGGLLLWAFGVLQKETSCCVLLLAPFLLPMVRAQRERWSQLRRPRRSTLGLIAAGVLLPFVPMAVRLVESAFADERFYEEAAAGKSRVQRLSEQLEQADGILHSPVPSVLFVAAFVLLALQMIKFGVDWLSVGLLVVAVAFVVFAAETGIVASRYYLPVIVLSALALARAVVPFGSIPVVLTGLALIGAGLWQADEGRGWVHWWRDGERDRETLVREAAGRQAGGCDVDVIGLNVELVQALPVLMPLADEPPHDCVSGERFMVVIDPGGRGTETPPDDPVLSACAPEPAPVWSSHIGKILRCTA
jgi:ABC-type multidrug transport system fused ATPase/permease subunit